MALLPLLCTGSVISPHTLELTLFEIMPNHKSELIAEYTNADKISFLEPVTVGYKITWQSLKDLRTLPD